MAASGNKPGFPRQRKRIQYVRDIPASAFQKLCRLLNVVESSEMNWRMLAADLGFHNDEIEVFALEACRPGGSPANKMLRTWDYMNHTVLELYNSLYQMKHGRAMAIIKDYVNENEHYKMEVLSGLGPETEQLVPPRQNRSYNGMDPSHLPGPSLPHMPSKNTYPHEHHDYYINQNPHRPVDRLPMDNTWHNQYYTQTGGNPMPNGQYYMKPVDAHFMYPNMDTQRHKELMSPDLCHVTSSDNQSTKSVTKTTSSKNNMALTALGFVNSFQHDKIVEATNNFSDEYKRGEGAFGTVYYAQIDFSCFAVKRLKRKSDAGHDTENFACADSLKEIPALLRYRHPNIVPLLGYSYDGPLPCLLYEYCEHGSLEDNLLGRDGRKALDWPTRHSIVLGAAIGLNFLHRAQPDKPLIHGDIKSANILLGKDFIPKIGDFGLARHGPTGGKLYTIMNTAEAHGTLPYLPDEYKRNRKLSTKVDVYSYGVVLLEVLTGLRAFDEKREPRGHQHVIELVEHVKETNSSEAAIERLKDMRCPAWPWDLAAELIDISAECTVKRFQKRPEMSAVAEKLHTLNDKCKGRMAIQSREEQIGLLGDQMMQSPMNSVGTIKPTVTERKVACSNTCHQMQQRTDDQMNTQCNGNTSETQRLNQKLEGLHIGIRNDNTQALANSGDRVDTQKISLWHKEGPCQSSDTSLSTSKLYSCGYSTEMTPGSSVQTPSSVPTSHLYDSSMPTTGSSFNQSSVNNNYPAAHDQKPCQRLVHPGYGSPVGMLQSGNANFGRPQFPGVYGINNPNDAVQYQPQYSSQSDVSSTDSCWIETRQPQQDGPRTPDSCPSVNPYVPSNMDGSFIPDPSLAPHAPSPQYLPHHLMPSQANLYCQNIQQSSVVQNGRLPSAPEQSGNLISKSVIPPGSSENDLPQSTPASGVLPHPSSTPVSNDLWQPVSMPISSDAPQLVSMPISSDAQQPVSMPILNGIRQLVSMPISNNAPQQVSQPILSDAQQQVSMPISSDAQQLVSMPISNGIRQPSSMPVSNDLRQPVSMPISNGIRQPLSTPISSNAQQLVSMPISNDIRQPVSMPISSNV